MDQAESACKSRGGKLPLPENANENADLLNAFKTVRPQVGVVMIGMSDLKSEGKWMKSNGEPVTYFNWATGEPNDAKIMNNGMQGEDYAVIRILSGKWNDHGKTSSKFDTICQLDCSSGKSIV